jgi:Protein of unknown function (DUF1501)
MLSLTHPGTRRCDGWTRREWLRVGGLGAFGLTLPAWLGARAQPTASPGRPRNARACILLFFLGAPPQHATWDPKPDAVPEVRGDLKPIASATPGILVGELMPRTARLTEKIAVLRAVQTNDNARSSSGSGHPWVSGGHGPCPIRSWQSSSLSARNQGGLRADSVVNASRPGYPPGMSKPLLLLLPVVVLLAVVPALANPFAAEPPGAGGRGLAGAGGCGTLCRGGGAFRPPRGCG